MELQKLSVADVSKVLLENDFPHDLIKSLAVNEIDGDLLSSLINDFQELQHLVPQSGWRIRLKRFVHSYSVPETQPSNDLSYVNFVSSSSIQDSTAPSEGLPDSSPIIPSTVVESQASSDGQAESVDGQYAGEELPNPFPLAKILPPDIQLLLSNKTLRQKQLNQLYTIVTREMLLYKLYPSRSDFESVAQQLLDEYPFLTSMVENKEKIVQAFRRRFNYFRRASKQYTSVDERCALKRGQVEKTLDSSKRPCEGKDSVTDNDLSVVGSCPNSSAEHEVPSRCHQNSSPVPLTFVDESQASSDNETESIDRQGSSTLEASSNSYSAIRKQFADEMLPHPFPLSKDLPPDVQQGLSCKTLGRKKLAKMCTVIAKQMVVYKLYPTKMDYNTIAQQMLEEYPFLNSLLGGDAIEQIVKLFQTRFTRIRRNKSYLEERVTSSDERHGVKRSHKEVTPELNKRACMEENTTGENPSHSASTSSSTIVQCKTPFESQPDSSSMSSVFLEKSQTPSTGQTESTDSSPTSRLNNTTLKASYNWLITRKKDRDDNELPHPFPLLRNLPPAIQWCLSRKTLKQNELCTLYSLVVKEMMVYKLYPTKTECQMVAEQLLDEYPFLTSLIGENSIDRAVKAMQRRCSEHRRNRNSKSQLDAKEHHLKQKLAEETATLNEQGCIQVDLDSKEVSFKHQCCLIQEEYKKAEPNKTAVCEAIVDSFEMRRNDILINARPIGHILQDYPFLKDKDEILSEMSRILQKPVPADDSNWTEMWLPKLLYQCTTDLSGDKQLCAKQLLKSYNDLQGVDSSFSLTVGLLKLLPFLIPDHVFRPAVGKFINCIPFLPESPSFFITKLFLKAPFFSVDRDMATSEAKIEASNLEETCTAPYLLVKEGVSCEQREAEVFLTVGRHILCKIPPTLATLYLLSAFRIFNINYPKGLVNLYTLMEKIILDEHGSKTTRTIRRIYTSLTVVD